MYSKTCLCLRHLWAWTQWVFDWISLWAQTQTRYFEKLCCGVTGTNFSPQIAKNADAPNVQPSHKSRSLAITSVEFNKIYCTALYAYREWTVFCTQPTALEFRSAQPQPWRLSERAHEPERHHQWPQQYLYPSSSLHERSDFLSSLEE